MQIKSKHYTIPIFIPELACPHRCVFCNQEKITARQSIPTLDEVTHIVESHLQTIPTGSEIDIGYLGGNFTGIDLQQQADYLALAQKYLSHGRISGIRLSTRPDYINPQIMNLLTTYGVTAVELGVQSTDTEVLLKSGRGHTIADIEKAVNLIKSTNINLGLQMMTGLPADTKEKALQTAKAICRWGANSTRIYPTLVVKDTPLAKLWHEGKYKPQTIPQAIDWLLDIVPIFEQHQVNILRIGLHPTEGFLDKSELLDGPFHPAFAELLQTEKWHRKFQHQLNFNKKKVLITVHPSDIPHAVGHQSKNKKWLLQQFDFVKFKQSIEVSKNSFHVDYC